MQEDIIAALQAGDGSWPADLQPLEPALRELLARGSEADDVAVSAAVLWSLVASGQTTQRGPSKAAVARTVAWLAENALTQAGGLELQPGQGLAAAVLVDLSRHDASPRVAAAALRAEARILETQRASGGWTVVGRAPDDAASLEATGWAALSMRLSRESGQAMADAYGKARVFLGARDGLAASAFDLYFDAVDGATERKALESAFQRFVEEREALRARPALGLIVSSAAYQLGGDVWKSWSSSELAPVAQAQIKEGPTKGFWPASGDPRGAAWDLAMSSMSLALYYRYANLGLVR